MDTMKKKIERRVRILGVCLMVLALLTAYVEIGPGFPVTSQVSENILQFQHGLRLGGMLCLWVVILRYSSAMRDEKKLEKLYYRMTDERMVMVRMKSGAPIMLGSAIALLVFGMAAMYLNTTVSLTLHACAVFLVLVAALSKAYWTAQSTGKTGD